MPTHALATPLSLANLGKLPERVARPAYARADLSPGILHFGVGNFHRAHLQVYLDRLMNTGKARDFAILGAGVTPYDAKMRDALAGQDWLSTVVEQSAAVSAARVTGVMTDFLPPMDGPAIIRALSDPAIRIVSLTVTEGGYFVNPALGKFDPESPAIVADAKNPDDPRTVFGLILAGQQPPESSLHVVYIALQIVKLAVLCALAARAKSRDQVGSCISATPAPRATVSTLSASSTLPLARRGSQSSAMNWSSSQRRPASWAMGSAPSRSKRYSWFAASLTDTSLCMMDRLSVLLR